MGQWMLNAIGISPWTREAYELNLLALDDAGGTRELNVLVRGRVRVEAPR